ncbi:hypothetical protein NQ317_010243 [Molorchus minor]|uniref:Uncharacterized protein n=1 Tax=Molorchus minor TaxID=1323400 RepID=A0ABQ9JIA6_9CUCU|nr:hypothetical protein NQ317_010243 [Molorchus minor]
MFAASGDVYKAIHSYTSWTEGGPKNTRYNRIINRVIKESKKMSIFSILLTIDANLHMGPFFPKFVRNLGIKNRLDKYM